MRAPANVPPYQVVDRLYMETEAYIMLLVICLWCKWFKEAASRNLNSRNCHQLRETLKYNSSNVKKRYKKHSKYNKNVYLAILK